MADDRPEPTQDDESRPDPAPGSCRPWREAMGSVGRTVAIVLGGGGLGLVAGMAYGAWTASTKAADAAKGDELLSLAGWMMGLVFGGAFGFVAGLAVGLLTMVLIWIVRLARWISTTRPDGEAP